MDEKNFQECADIVKNSQAIVITAGAGMSVDSGLKTYWGRKGVWNISQSLKLAKPRAFLENPKLAWGFQMSRMREYRNIKPHDGYKILFEWVNRYNLDYFVVTSNIDGYFQKMGFDKTKFERYTVQCIIYNAFINAAKRFGKMI